MTCHCKFHCTWTDNVPIMGTNKKTRQLASLVAFKIAFKIISCRLECPYTVALKPAKSKEHFHQGTGSLKGELRLCGMFLQPHRAESELKTPAVAGF